MFKWIVKKLLGETKKQIEKTITESSTTRTVAVASVSTIAVVRAILAFLGELGLIPIEMVDETAMVVCAVFIPLISRLLAIVKSKMGD